MAGRRHVTWAGLPEASAEGRLLDAGRREPATADNSEAGLRRPGKYRTDLKNLTLTKTRYLLKRERERLE